MTVDGSVVMIGDPDDKLYGEPRTLGRTSASLHLFVDDDEAMLRRALKAGAEQVQPPTEMFYGANSASLRDPFGHVWVLQTWKEDLDPVEMERRQRAPSPVRLTFHPREFRIQPIAETRHTQRCRAKLQCETALETPFPHPKRR